MLDRLAAVDFSTELKTKKDRVPGKKRSFMILRYLKSVTGILMSDHQELIRLCSFLLIPMNNIT